VRARLDGAKNNSQLADACAVVEQALQTLVDWPVDLLPQAARDYAFTLANVHCGTLRAAYKCIVLQVHYSSKKRRTRTVGPQKCTRLPCTCTPRALSCALCRFAEQQDFCRLRLAKFYDSQQAHTLVVCDGYAANVKR
jgi:hypothetical protein